MTSNINLEDIRRQLSAIAMVSVYEVQQAIDAIVASERKTPMHPVDEAIITDWLMDDEDMTWDERDGRYLQLAETDHD